MMPRSWNVAVSCRAKELTLGVFTALASTVGPECWPGSLWFAIETGNLVRRKELWGWEQAWFAIEARLYSSTYFFPSQVSTLGYNSHAGVWTTKFSLPLSFCSLCPLSFLFLSLSPLHSFPPSFYLSLLPFFLPSFPLPILSFTCWSPVTHQALSLGHYRHRVISSWHLCVVGAAAVPF